MIDPQILKAVKVIAIFLSIMSAYCAGILKVQQRETPWMLLISSLFLAWTGAA